jgi:hypothetical protein
MKAPDAVAFAFNPCFLQFENIRQEKLTVFIRDDQDQQLARIVINTLNGNATLDISAYIRGVFAGYAKEDGVFPTSCPLSITVGSVTFDLCTVYGATLPGEMFNASRSVRLWSAYPQVVSFFHSSLSSGESSVYIQKDNQEAQIWQPSQDTFYRASISNYDNQAEETPMQKSGQIVIYPASEDEQLTFSTQFDGTFSGIAGEVIINISVDDTPQCDDHIFLRWLDRHGFWQYWLCKIGDVQVTDAVIGDALTFFTGTSYATRNIGKNLVKKVSACATNLTEEEWLMLSTIKGSINVCAFDTASQSWVPVSITAGTSTWKMGNQASHRQDFPLVVTFPTIPTQRL